MSLTGAPHTVVMEYRGGTFARPDRSVSARRIEALLEQSANGCLVSTLTEIAAAAPFPTVSAARISVLALSHVDHYFSVDVEVVGEREAFEIVWAPATAIIDLMLDWDLSVLDLGFDELCGWLAVTPVVAMRALERLSTIVGVDVVLPSDQSPEVQVCLDIAACPLTAVAFSGE